MKALIFCLLAMLSLPVAAQDQTQSSQLVNNLVQGCWACGAFNTISAIGLSFADQVFSQLASGMTILIGLFMALWVLYFAARMFLPFGPATGLWNEGAQKLFKLMLVLAFLASSTPFWQYIFIPMISAGMGVASQMVSTTDGFEAQFGTSESPPNGTVDYCSGTPPAINVKNLSTNATSAAQAMAQMDCPLSKIESQFSKGIVIGEAIMWQAPCSSSLWTPLKGINSFVAGLLMILVFGFGYLIFPFLLIDVVMRVSLVAATSPLLIAAALFKSTAKMTERGLWSLVQCSLTLVFGGAIAGIGKAAIAYVLSLSSTAKQPLPNWQTLSNALENPCSAGLSIGFTSASYYMLIGIAIILIFMMRRAGHLATEITGIAAEGTGIQAASGALLGTAGWAIGKSAQTLVKRMTNKSPPVDKPQSDSVKEKAEAVTGNNKQK
jgi:hypothetical protein